VFASCYREALRLEQPQPGHAREQPGYVPVVLHPDPILVPQDLREVRGDQSITRVGVIDPLKVAEAAQHPVMPAVGRARLERLCHKVKGDSFADDDFDDTGEAGGVEPAEVGAGKHPGTVFVVAVPCDLMEPGPHLS